MSDVLLGPLPGGVDALLGPFSPTPDGLDLCAGVGGNFLLTDGEVRAYGS